MPVGKTLAAARRAQNKTIAEIQSTTRIMGRTLHALESERWEDLPAEVYVKGYIQNYAAALGLDAAPLLEEYAADRGSMKSADLERIPGRTVVPHQREIHVIPRKAWLALAGIVVLAVLVIWGIVALVSGDDSPPPIPPVTPTSTIETTAVVPGVTGAEATVPSLETTEAAASAFTLSITVEEGVDSWMRISIDGAVEFEGTMPGGSEKDYSVASQATVRIGKPASVTVKRDGRVVQVPLGEGIAEVTLTADE
mgnify:FL=1